MILVNYNAEVGVWEFIFHILPNAYRINKCNKATTFAFKITFDFVKYSVDLFNSTMLTSKSKLMRTYYVTYIYDGSDSFKTIFSKTLDNVGNRPIERYEDTSFKCFPRLWDYNNLTNFP